MNRANRKPFMPPGLRDMIGKTRLYACHKKNPAGTKIIRRTLAVFSGTIFSKKTRRALDGTFR